MQNNHLKPAPCKYGIYCKFGPHCRFYHPQRFMNPIYSMNVHQKSQIDHLSQQFLAMNLNSQASMNHNDASNQMLMDDAQFQQIMHQQSVFQKYTSQKLASQPKVYEKNKKWQQNSSDSNSDMQSNSDEDTKDKKHKYEKVKENKNQKLSYLYGQDKIKKENKKAYHHEHSKKKVDQQSYYLYYSALLAFFEKRRIKEHKRQKIVRFLAKQIRYDPMSVQFITSKVEELEKEGFIAYCCYKKLFKTIVKQNFEMEAIKAKLMKKINIEKKRMAKDAEFHLRFPYPAYIQFLQSFDLLQNHYQNKDTIYLIDGNNCLTTQKHLRYFFQQKDQHSKAEAQIRFRWLISQVFKDPKRCFVFFDDKFDKKMYEETMDRLMSEEEENKMVQSMTVIYADPGNEADELIRNKMKELKQILPAQKLNDVILVTADRILTQECFMIHPLRRSSGMYLVKFFKKFLKKQAKVNPTLKKTVKRILNYGD